MAMKIDSRPEELLMKKRQLRLKAWVTRTLVALLVFLAFTFISGFWVGLLLGFMVALLLWKVRYRTAMLVSLGLLVSSPLMLVLGLSSTAVALANWAFYILAVAIVIMYVDYLRLSWASTREPAGKSAEGNETG